MTGTGQSVDGIAAALVGRDGEQRKLGDLLERAVDGRGRLVLIGGEAGIGKTALVESVVEDAVSRGALVLSGGCYDLTAPSPYGPWHELARRYQAHCGGRPEMPPAPDFLQEGPAEDAARNQTMLFEQVAVFVSDLGRRCPLLLVLEDMHWADGESLDLLRVLARRFAEVKALMLVTYRAPGEAGPAPIERLVPLLVREARAERMRLQPLDLRALDALTARRYNLAAEPHEQLLAYLVAHSQGNPFLALELLHALEEERRLRPGGRGWSLHDLEAAGVPPLFQEMIEARVSRLSGPARQHLPLAAIIGREVALEVWQTALAITEAEMIDTVDALSRAQLVRPLPEGDAVRFNHALTHAAVYQMILPPRRRVLHRAIADLLAESPGVDPDQVAWHYRKAGDDRAARWLVRAGERAQRSYAWSAAVERLIEAAGLLAGSENAREHGWLRYRIGRLRRHADPVDAGRWMEMAERFGEVAGDPALIAFARFDRGHIQVLAGAYRHGLETMVAGDLLLDALQPDHLTGEIAAWTADALPQDAPVIVGQSQVAGDGRRGTLVQWLVEAGRFAEARELGEAYAASQPGSRPLDDQHVSSMGDAWFGLGRVYAHIGRPTQARTALDRALDCYRGIDHHLLMASTLRVLLAEVLIPFQTLGIEERWRIAAQAEQAYRRASGATGDSLTSGFASLEQMIFDGRWMEAYELLETLAGQPGGIVVWRHRTATLLARLEYERGRPERARAWIREVLPSGPETEPGTTTYTRGIELQLLAVELALDEGNLELAEIWLNALDRWLSWSGAVRGQAEAMLASAACFLASGDARSAHECAAFAQRAAEDPEQPLMQLAAERFLGELETSQARFEEASERLDRALSIAEECEAPFEIALTRLALAELRAASGAAPEARSLLDQARDGFERLGASRSLARAGRLEAQLDGGSQAKASPFGLTEREMEVLRLVAAGLTDAQAAEQLFISYRTVTTHLTSIFNKLGVNSRVSATRIAVEHRLV